MTQDEWDAHVFQYGERRDGLVWNARHGGADVLADDSRTDAECVDQIEPRP
jgi:hypothetical protein